MQTLAKVVLVASLIGWLAGCGLQTSTGTPVASGKVWFFDPGTNVPQTVWADSAESATLSQPVILDAAGRATVYTKNTVDIVVEDSSGASLGTLGNANDIPAAEVTVDPSVSAGPHLSDTLTAAVTSLGAPDFQYLDSPGATPMNVGTWMSDVHFDVKAFGAKGDGLAIDTSAIQKAINRAKAAGGGVVYFPPGTYLIDATLVQSGTNGVSFEGSGFTSSSIQQTNGAANGITISNAQSFFIRNLRIDHSTSSTGNAIDITGSLQGAVIEQVFIRRFNISIHFDSSLSSTVRDCQLLSVGGGTSRVLSYTTSGLFHVIAGGAMTSGVAMIEFNLPGGGRSTISGVTFGNLGASGAVLITAGTDIVVSGCSGVPASGNPFQTALATSDFLQQQGDGTTENVLSGATTSAPKWMNAQSWKAVGTTIGAPYVVPAPTPTPSRRGTILRMTFANGAGAPVTGWTLNAIYHRSASAIALLDGHRTIVTFEYDVDAAVWREIGFSDTN